MIKSTIFLAGVMASINQVEAHGYLTSPLPRQYREEGLEGIEWTKWMGITVPGDGSFIPGDRNAANLNAGIGGGVGGRDAETTVGHGLCGDLGSRKGFESGKYGATQPRMTVAAGNQLPISVKLTAYHAGWFEFRLCNPGPSGTITQECLNEHVLEIDESTPYYPQILDYANMKGLSYSNNPNQDGGWYKCQTSGGFSDPTSNTPNTVWPSGSCCNGGGDCSDPVNNKDRYVVEFSPGGTGDRNYDIVLKVPENLNCDNCILQWFYQTANSRETYPESFWNCADIAVTGDGTPSPPTSSPPTLPTSASPAPTSAPPTTNSPTTTTSTDNSGCNQCVGCWWTATTPEQGCYGWDAATCALYAPDYKWCSGEEQEVATPAPTTTPPTSTTTTPPTTNPVNNNNKVCVTHAQLMAINAESSYWPNCDPSQPTKGSASGYVFGYYCTQEWTDNLNVMLQALGYCNDMVTIRKFLAQTAYETGYFSTLGQPLDDGSGIIHMIPQNWLANAQDMDAVFPGEGLLGEFQRRDDVGKASFFKEPQYAYKSAAAWFKRTNRVIPGCGRDLFPLSLDEQTACILGRVVSRAEALTIVSRHIPLSGSDPLSTPSPTPVTVSPISTPAPSTSPPTVGGSGDSECGTCSGCWWTATSSDVGCYAWSSDLCASYASGGYTWCGN